MMKTRHELIGAYWHTREKCDEMSITLQPKKIVTKIKNGGERGIRTPDTAFGRIPV
jgi:hypothetical protein